MTLFDAVGLAFASLAVLWAVIVVVKIQPVLLKLIDDFGGQISPATRICLKPWFPLVLGLPPLLLVGEGIFRGVGERGRAFRAGLAILLSLLAPVVLLAGIYLPLFDLLSGLK